MNLVKPPSKRQLSLRHLLLLMAIASAALAWLSVKWKNPVAPRTYLSFGTTNESLQSPIMASYSVMLPDSEVIFLDFFPYGTVDECLVIDPGGAQRRFEGIGRSQEHPNQSRYPPMPGPFEQRFRKARELFLIRMSEKMRRHFESNDPHHPPFHAPPEFANASMMIRLNRNLLETREDDVHYDFWSIPIDQW